MTLDGLIYQFLTELVYLFMKEELHNLLGYILLGYLGFIHGVQDVFVESKMMQII